jgi:hypothetical protein
VIVFVGLFCRPNLRVSEVFVRCCKVSVGDQTEAAGGFLRLAVRRAGLLSLAIAIAALLVRFAVSVYLRAVAVLPHPATAMI